MPTQKAMISKGYHLECRAYELLELKKRHSGQISGHRSDLIHCTFKILTSVKSVHRQKKDQNIIIFKFSVQLATASAQRVLLRRIHNTNHPSIDKPKKKPSIFLYFQLI